MLQGELIAIRPLRVWDDAADTRAALSTSSAPIAVKRYGPDDPVFDALITGDDVEASFTLKGHAAGSPLLKGALEPVGAGKWRARLTLEEHVGGVIHVEAGALKWHLDGDAGETPLDLQNPEMLIFPPEGDLSFAPRGLPAALLRTLADVHRTLQVSAPSASPPWKAFVDTVFTNNPPRYDVVQGAPHYTDIPDWNHLVFHLGRYQAARRDPSSLINCYDCAAYLQILMRPSYPTRYCFMQPFGYLKQTDLIGRGQCNNPFTRFTAPLVVPQTLASRTCFGNHAFCSPSQSGVGVIADGCAGPHYADTPAGYVAAAVDTVTPTPPRVRAGTVADIGYYYGVVNVDNMVRLGAETAAFMTSRTESPFAANRAAFLQAIGGAPTRALAASGPRAVPDPSGSPVLEGWDKVHEDLVVGYPESSRQWRFVRDQSSVVVTCWVANDADLAHERFLQLGSVHQSDEPIFERGPDGLGDLSAQSLQAERHVLIWNQANVTTRIETNDPGFDLVSLATELTKAADRKAERSEPPTIGGLAVTPSEVAVGETFTIRVDTDAGNQIDFAISEDLATFDRQQGSELTFQARAPGSLQISVAVTDPVSLLSAQRTASVTIVRGE